MTETPEFLESTNDCGILIIADHASKHVPADIDLGIPAALLDTHIAQDIGVAALSRQLNTDWGYASVLAGVSRLVVDLNREEDAANIMPVSSDGHAIPGNVISAADRQARIERFWHPYHAFIAAHIASRRPKLLVSLHSFTPQLETAPSEARPWEIGILYNQDDRAARIAIPLLAAAGVVVGDQLPYSGKILNATMNLHGEGNGIPYLGIEMRQDLISDAAGVAKWAAVLSGVIDRCGVDLF